MSEHQPVYRCAQCFGSGVVGLLTCSRCDGTGKARRYVQRVTRIDSDIVELYASAERVIDQLRTTGEIREEPN